MPRTPYLVFLDNYNIGAHSLFLLDLNPSNDIAYKGNELYLKAHKALQFLLDIPKIMEENGEIEERDLEILDNTTPAIIASRLGFSDEKILYGQIGELIALDKTINFQPPLCIIIPGDMHEMEKKYLEQFKILNSKVE
jgi:diphthamide biosynthesis methyltransferase